MLIQAIVVFCLALCSAANAEDSTYDCNLNICVKMCGDTGAFCIQNKTCESRAKECLDVPCVSDCSVQSEFVVYEIYKRGAKNRTKTERDNLIDLYYEDLMTEVKEDTAEVARLMKKIPEALIEEQGKRFDPNLQ